jgi:site-specific DNA-cytosine methylase
MSTRVVKSRVFQRPRGFNSGGFMETISPTVTASSFQFNAYIEMQEEYREYDDGPNVMTPKRTEFGKSIRKRYESGDIKLSRHKMTEMEARTDGISNTLTTVQKDNVVMTKEYRNFTTRGRMPGNPSFRGRSNGEFQQRPEFCPDGRTNTISTVQKDNLLMETTIETRERLQKEGWKWNPEKRIWERRRFRRYTPRECFRLMDMSESDIDKIQNAGISETQQYKMAGNSIVVACLAGIFGNLFDTTERIKTTLF